MEMRALIRLLLELPDFDHVSGSLIQQSQDFIIEPADVFPMLTDVLGTGHVPPCGVGRSGERLKIYRTRRTIARISRRSKWLAGPKSRGPSGGQNAQTRGGWPGGHGRCVPDARTGSDRAHTRLRASLFPRSQRPRATR